MRAAVLTMALMGCAIEPGEPDVPAPLAGLYTPGSQLGASDPTDDPRSGGLGNRCLTQDEGSDEDAGVAGGTPGELMLRYETKSLMGYYAPKNCSAVWIEDAGGNFVATLEVTARLRRYSLLYWQDRACPEQLGPDPDAVTSATRRTHDMPHVVTWDGRDALGRLLPDGTYELWIEVTETDKEPGVAESFEFVKGPSATNVQLSVLFEGALAEASLAWTPEPGGSP